MNLGIICGLVLVLAYHQDGQHTNSYHHDHQKGQQDRIGKPPANVHPGPLWIDL
jgi:hypothetical protein